MNVLFLNRSYWPDVEATGQLLTELCTDLAPVFHVFVITGRPNFSERSSGRLFEKFRRDGVQIVRVGNFRFSKANMLGRAIGLLSYLLLAAWVGFTQPKPDIIVVETDPPLLGALGAFLKIWHRCSLVFYLQDLYPEVGLALGRLKPGVLVWILHAATQLGMRAADRVIVLGDDMCRRVLARGIRIDKVRITPNWADTQLIRPWQGKNALRSEWNPLSRFLVMYSGNLGLSQNLEAVLEVASRLRNIPILFIIIGEGAAKATLVQRTRESSLDNIRFLPYQMKERLSESLGAADLHLIPLRRGVAGALVPSKLYGILAAGRPYIAAVEDGCDVATITRDHGTGLVIAPDDADGLELALRWCLNHPQEVEVMGQRGRQVAERLFDRRVSVARFANVLRETQKGKCRNF